MTEINVLLLNEKNKVHFIGIGGISMSGLAEILLHRNCQVSGSDMKSTPITEHLEREGAKIFIGHSAENITDCDFVVYTAAIKADNPEMVRAKELGIPCIERAAFLGAIMKCYPKAVAVSGTHGKTTTTSMLSYCMIKGETDPTITVGGELDLIGGNLRIGSSDYFLAEACEYCQSFLKFFPYISVITNIEEDHLDFYTGIDHIIDTFHQFALITPKDGAIVAYAGDANIQKALQGVDREIITYGAPGADWTAENTTFNRLGHASFQVYHKGEFYAEVSLSVPGMHNVLNALASIAVSTRLAIRKEAILEGLADFRGTKRRFEYKGEVNGASIIDDYAHHPTEIKATLDALAMTEHNEVWCVFQPHTYTRTHAFLNDFAEALTGDYHVIITDIYAAREKDTGLVSAKDLAAKIPNALYMKDFSEIESFLKEQVSAGDIVMTIGAGNVVEIGEHLAD